MNSAHRAIPAGPASETRMLPMLEVGVGERNAECARYAGESGCLSRFVRLHPGEEQARCPVGCPDVEVVPAHVRLALASLGHDRWIDPEPAHWGDDERVKVVPLNRLSKKQRAARSESCRMASSSDALKGTIKAATKTGGH